MSNHPSVSDADLQFYIDNQLDAAGRLRVETYLAHHPAAAAQVMADLGIRTTLRLAMASDGAPARQDTREAARRLSSSLAGRQMWSRLHRVAAVGVLLSLGWFASTYQSPLAPREVSASVPPPVFVEEAVRAHQTSLVRAAMPSQPEVRVFDREDIRASTAIVMPRLPEGWETADVQVFPSDFGPSVEMRLQTDKGIALSLFAVRPGRFAVEQVQELVVDDAAVAWWQIGDVAYALVSDEQGTELGAQAERLKNSLY
ncbi:MAG: anti-sigma factor family protein [Pseudorhizobium sp.]